MKILIKEISEKSVTVEIFRYGTSKIYCLCKDDTIDFDGSYFVGNESE